MDSTMRVKRESMSDDGMMPNLELVIQHLNNEIQKFFGENNYTLEIVPPADRYMPNFIETIGVEVNTLKLWEPSYEEVNSV